jgi:hypothetical protein
MATPGYDAVSDDRAGACSSCQVPAVRGEDDLDSVGRQALAVYAHAGRRIGRSPSMVRRVWKAHGLKPHRSKTFKLSNDPRFAEKLIDVVGLYRNPPEHAIVLCVDEKSQIQALDRTQKSLPIYPAAWGR